MSDNVQTNAGGNAVQGRRGMRGEMRPAEEPILEVEGLFLSFTQYGAGLRQRTLEVIHDLSLSAHAGEVVAVVGASGSGKSLLAHAIFGILPDNAVYHILLCLLELCLQPLVGESEHLGSEYSCVLSSVYRNCCNGYARGHLYCGKKGIKPVK